MLNDTPAVSRMFKDVRPSDYLHAGDPPISTHVFGENMLNDAPNQVLGENMLKPGENMLNDAPNHVLGKNILNKTPGFPCNVKSRKHPPRPMTFKLNDL